VETSKVNGTTPAYTIFESGKYNYSKYYSKITLSCVCSKIDVYRYRLSGWL